MAITHAQLGIRFIRAGVKLFILALVMSLGMISHYLVGARYPTCAAFLGNIAAWFGCPWTISTAVVLVGALAMIAMGCVYSVLGGLDSKVGANYPARLSLYLCSAGLIAIFLTGYVGYFAIDANARGFYYTPLQGPKNFWLSEQLACVIVFMAGIVAASRGMKRLGSPQT